MKSYSKLLFLILIIFTLMLSACGMEGGLSVENLEDVEDVNPDVDPQEIEKALTEEGQAIVYYHYQVTHEIMNFNIELELPTKFNQNSDGTWEAGALGETEVVLKLIGVGPGQCQVVCNIPINIIGTGKIAPISDTQCKLPMSFQFVAQEDWIESRILSS